MNELLPAFTLIALVRFVADPCALWQVWHQTGDYELEEDTAEALGDGRLHVAYESDGFNTGYTVTGVYHQAGEWHEITGHAGVVGGRTYQGVKRDGVDMAAGEVYVVSRLTEDEGERYVIAEFRFREGAAFHRMRFKRVIEG